MLRFRFAVHMPDMTNVENRNRVGTGRFASRFTPEIHSEPAGVTTLTRESSPLDETAAGADLHAGSGPLQHGDRHLTAAPGQGGEEGPAMAANARGDGRTRPPRQGLRNAAPGGTGFRP